METAIRCRSWKTAPGSIVKVNRTPLTYLFFDFLLSRTDRRNGAQGDGSQSGSAKAKKRREEMRVRAWLAGRGVGSGWPAHEPVGATEGFGRTDKLPDCGLPTVPFPAYVADARRGHCAHL